jgi:hypothetical protein
MRGIPDSFLSDSFLNQAAGEALQEVYGEAPMWAKKLAKKVTTGIAKGVEDISKLRLLPKTRFDWLKSEVIRLRKRGDPKEKKKLNRLERRMVELAYPKFTYLTDESVHKYAELVLQGYISGDAAWFQDQVSGVYGAGSVDKEEDPDTAFLLGGYEGFGSLTTKEIDPEMAFWLDGYGGFGADPSPTSVQIDPQWKNVGRVREQEVQVPEGRPLTEEDLYPFYETENLLAKRWGPGSVQFSIREDILPEL